LMNIFLNGIIEPFLKITEMHKLFIFHSLSLDAVRDRNYCHFTPTVRSVTLLLDYPVLIVY
jgi:hypothetical protein